MGIHVRRPVGPGAALAAAVLLAAGAWGQEADPARLEADLQKARAEIAQLKRDIQKADAEQRKSDSLMRDEAARASQAEERQNRDRERREKENAVLQGKLQEAQGRLGSERSAMARHQNAIDEVKARQKQLAMALAGWCDSLEKRIEAAPPWESASRLERVRSLKKDLEAGTAAPEEGFSRLSAVIREEIKAGDEIAVLNQPVTRKDGQVVNAQILRIGNQWLAYADEEGKHFGVLERSGGAWVWREDPGFTERRRLQDALEVKAAKRPPQLVVLDLGVDLPGTAKPPGEAAKGGQP